MGDSYKSDNSDDSNSSDDSTDSDDSDDERTSIDLTDEIKFFYDKLCQRSEKLKELNINSLIQIANDDPEKESCYRQ